MEIKKYLYIANDILFMFAGSVLYALGLVGFLQPSNISPGGISGIATIVHYLWGFPTGITLLLLNLPLLIIGYLKLGGSVITKTLISTVFSSVSIDVLSRFINGFGTERILSALAAGVLCGFGIALIFTHGSTSGGTDIAAKLLRKKYPYVSMGRLILIMDAVVILLAAISYRDMESALYSVLEIVISTAIIDKFLYGADGGKIAFIITSQPEKIKSEILSTLQRGVSEINISGGYSGTGRTLLLCAFRRQQTAELHRIIKDTDAFIMIADAGEILGTGFVSSKLNT